MHSRPGPAGRRSSHVRYAPKATVGHQNAIGRDVPKRTHAPQQTASLFDHLVGERENAGRKIETECLGSLEIDDEL